MTEIMPFTFPATGQPVRTLLVDGEPMVCHVDVCQLLQHSNPSVAIQMVDEDDRRLIDLSESDIHALKRDVPGNARTWFLTESGFYTLALSSRAPGAHTLRRWITKEVIPSIRKTGSYSAAPMTELEVARNYVAALQREQELRTVVAALAEDAHHWNTLATAGTDLDVASAAKVLSRDSAIETGRGRLFTFLAAQGWIYRTGGHWSPYQSQVDNGRLMVLPQSHYHPRTGDLVLDPPQIRITVKGLAELHKRLGGASQFQALMSEEVAA